MPDRGQDEVRRHVTNKQRCTPGKLDSMKNPIADYQQLRERVAQLETDIQESRQLSQRLAEVTDVLAEVLLPAEQRDEARLADLLAKYDKAI